jgi:Kef-type K+ transport system membrane component KefB
MNTWWWVAIGLIAWFGVSLAVGLLLGRVFRRSSQVREALDAQERETPAERQEPPQEGPRVA